MPPLSSFSRCSECAPNDIYNANLHCPSVGERSETRKKLFFIENKITEFSHLSRTGKWPSGTSCPPTSKLMSRNTGRIQSHSPSLSKRRSLRVSLDRRCLLMTTSWQLHREDRQLLGESHHTSGNGCVTEWKGTGSRATQDLM